MGGSQGPGDRTTRCWRRSNAACVMANCRATACNHSNSEESKSGKPPTKAQNAKNNTDPFSILQQLCHKPHTNQAKGRLVSQGFKRRQRVSKENPAELLLACVRVCVRVTLTVVHFPHSCLTAHTVSLLFPPLHTTHTLQKAKPNKTH